MRHPLHIALSVPAAVPAAASAPVPAAVPAPAPGRHRRRSAPASVSPAQRLAAGLGLASVPAVSVLTAVVEPAAPVAPDRAPARQSSTFAQLSGD
ncbi:hypothetical protein [Streptomyces sp. ISL-94]|uniref:hypothetical protein n=1 Tax=Streptomyces sp. ISL-94 TaxID=2819190 RepID=UPI001BE68129|nr:hypothetical protein [Streptomyces sp. ISL-94]MBT2478261.1 hypothetical protein [Streptomyces sp. ISL-94]